MKKNLAAISVLAVGLTGAFFYFGRAGAQSSDLYRTEVEASLHDEIASERAFTPEPEDSAAPYADGVVPKEEGGVFPRRSAARAKGVSESERVQRILANWPRESRTTANLAVKRFGPPVSASPEALAWNKSGPWGRTEVFRSGEKRSFPLEHRDIIRQSVPRQVTAEQAAILEQMDIGLSVAGKPTLLSSISDSEESNFLGINVADEVLSGERSPEEARAFYRKTSQAAAAGKSSPYTERILGASDKSGLKTEAVRETVPENAQTGVRVPRSRLSVTEVTGVLRINPLGDESSRVEVALPFIAPDSSVRVLSGRARFRGDFQTDIVASAGTRFAFKASENPPTLYLELLEDHSEMLEVSVAGKTFLMQRKDSAVFITEPTDGAFQVATSGKVELIIDKDSQKTPARGGTFVRNSLEAPSGNWMSVNAVSAALTPAPSVYPGTWKVARKSDGGILLSDPYQGLPAPGPEAVEGILAQWPDLTREAAEMMVEKYGAPEYISVSEMEWNNAGPWSKTIVRRTGMRGVMRHESVGILQQSVRYAPLRGDAESLEQLHGDVTWNEMSRELTAMGDSEEANFLALNVADQFITGKLTAAQARALYEDTQVKALSGKSSAYLEGLRFLRD